MSDSVSDHREIPLTRGYVALVDAEDYDALAQFQWQVTIDGRGGGPYARRSLPRTSDGRRPQELMHRRLLPGDEQVDHINGDGLDNRRTNLRLATPIQNSRNRSGPDRTGTSGYRGVHWNKRDQAWMAQIYLGRRRKHLGYFTTAEEAARAFDAAALEHYGDFVGALNFSLEEVST